MMKSAPSYASAAEDMTNFMTWVMVNMGPFQRGTGLCLARKMWDPDWVQPLDSLCNPTSKCAASTVLLALYMIPSLG